MKLLTVVGARPQFIKHAPVANELAQLGLNSITVHTGQHYDKDMSEVFFEELQIRKPEYNLGVGSGGHGAQTGTMMIELEKIIEREQPTGVMVYGDTNSTLAGALVASKLHIPVFHVESGLRSFDMRMPEEINRVLTDHVAHWLFTPTTQAIVNLKREGIAASRIELVGDVMLDAYNHFLPVSSKENLSLPPNYCLATIHRAENTDRFENLKAITDGLRQISQHFPVVIPLHPRTKHALHVHGLLVTWEESFEILPPASYLKMLALENSAILILTDSGGVQKEAFFAKKNCITLRENTEWVELVELGVNRLNPPTHGDALLQNALDLAIRPFPNLPAIYGTGNASRLIACRLQEFLMGTF